MVDNLFHKADKDEVAVKDFCRSVAGHFNISKVEKEMKKMIKKRLTDLIQGNVELKSSTVSGAPGKRVYSVYVCMW